MKIAILQPFIPHYRKGFFLGLKNKLNIDLFCYENKDKVKNTNFKLSDINNKSILNLNIGPFLIYNPFVFLTKEYNQLVLMLHIGHLSTWFLLLTKSLHKKKITLWGQGISVKRYIKEEKTPSILLKWMIGLSDNVWFYTKKEKKQWELIFPDKKMVALDNTISEIENIVVYKTLKSKEELKKEYKIEQERCFIFCARFNNNFRRQDLLLQIIEQFDTAKYGFIIVGSGVAKPNFSEYKNVYDFGAVYEESIKQDLFSIADLYIQPGWVGLSIVEAMAYGKPIITFQRSESILQCVEFSYLENGYNSLIFANIHDLKSKFESIHNNEIEKLGINAKRYVEQNLLMEDMVATAIESLKLN